MSDSSLPFPTLFLQILPSMGRGRFAQRVGHPVARLPPSHQVGVRGVREGEAQTSARSPSQQAAPNPSILRCNITPPRTHTPRPDSDLSTGPEFYRSFRLFSPELSSLGPTLISRSRARTAFLELTGAVRRVGPGMRVNYLLATELRCWACLMTPLQEVVLSPVHRPGLGLRG